MNRRFNVPVVSLASTACLLLSGISLPTFAQSTALGSTIAVKGNAAGAIACVTCHGAKGEGNRSQPSGDAGSRPIAPSASTSLQKSPVAATRQFCDNGFSPSMLYSAHGPSLRLHHCRNHHAPAQLDGDWRVLHARIRPGCTALRPPPACRGWRRASCRGQRCSSRPEEICRACALRVLSSRDGSDRYIPRPAVSAVGKPRPGRGRRAAVLGLHLSA